jgi:hypothetical protein
MQTTPDRFRVLLGQKANGCWLGYGSVLFLEFGEPIPDDLKHHRSGEWSLWSDQILWRIEQGERVVAGSEDDRQKMEAAVAELNGHTLLSITIDPETRDSVLAFTEDFVLHTFVLTSEEETGWNFRQGNSEFGPVDPEPPAVTAIDTGEDRKDAGR